MARKYSCRASSSTLSGGKPPFFAILKGPVAFYALKYTVTCAYLLRALYFTRLIRLRLRT